MLKHSQRLAWLGLLPFIIALAMQFLHWKVLAVEGILLFISYSVVILSFLAGTLWGQSNHSLHSKHQHLIIFSNIWALISWFALLLHLNCHYDELALILLIAVYIHIIVSELNFNSQVSLSNSIPAYKSMRKAISACVIVLHLLLLLVITV